MPHRIETALKPSLSDPAGRKIRARIASDLGLERAADSVLLDRAATDKRVVVTADTDFPHLLALSRDASPGVILVRGGDYATREVQGILSAVLSSIPETTLTQSICVADRARIRCRALPLEP